MPCYRCGTRQVDPGRGESPWKRGVRADRQVLTCPACQKSPDWLTDLDRCQECGSTRLVRRLGEVECRNCGFVHEPDSPAGGDRAPGAGVTAAPVGSAADPGGTVNSDGPAPGAEPAAEPAPLSRADADDIPGLAEEVELALARVLGRARRPARIG